MSTFITSNKNKNIIVSYIKSKVDDLAYLDFEELNIGLSTQGMLNQLHNLNMIAFGTRYQGRHTEGIESPISMPGMRADKMQTFKSISCLLYQCAEGDVDKSPLYKDLRKLESYVAKQIVMDMPEYDQADWD